MRCHVAQLQGYHSQYVDVSSVPWSTNQVGKVSTHEKGVRRDAKAVDWEEKI